MGEEQRLVLFENKAYYSNICHNAVRESHFLQTTHSSASLQIRILFQTPNA